MFIQDIASSVLTHKSESDAHLVQSLNETAIGNLRSENVLQRQFLFLLPPLEKSRLFFVFNLESKDSARLRNGFLVLFQDFFELVVGAGHPAILAPPFNTSIPISCPSMFQKADITQSVDIIRKR